MIRVKCVFFSFYSLFFLFFVYVCLNILNGICMLLLLLIDWFVVPWEWRSGQWTRWRDCLDGCWIDDRLLIVEHEFVVDIGQLFQAIFLQAHESLQRWWLFAGTAHTMNHMALLLLTYEENVEHLELQMRNENTDISSWIMYMIMNSYSRRMKKRYFFFIKCT